MTVALLGSGYIGKELIAPLKTAGHKVRASTTTPSKVTALKDFADEVYLMPQDLKAFLRDCETLMITVAPKAGSDYQSTYVDTAKNICEHQTDVKHLIYTSSTSVYGDCQGGWVDEKSEVFPETAQGKLLLEAESIYLKSFSPHTNVCVLRLGGIYGPGREIEKRIEKLSGASLPGDGLSYTNLVHRDDVIQAILWAQQHNLNGVYNVVEETHMLRKDLYAALSRRYQLPEVTWDATKPSVHTGNKRVSSAKLKETGFCFTNSCCGSMT